MQLKMKEAGDAPKNIQLLLDRLEHEREPHTVLPWPRFALPVLSPD
jgi:hypothetical protein